MIRSKQIDDINYLFDENQKMIFVGDTNMTNDEKFDNIFDSQLIANNKHYTYFGKRFWKNDTKARYIRCYYKGFKLSNFKIVPMIVGNNYLSDHDSIITILDS